MFAFSFLKILNKIQKKVRSTYNLLTQRKWLIGIISYRQLTSSLLFLFLYLILSEHFPVSKSFLRKHDLLKLLSIVIP